MHSLFLAASHRFISRRNQQIVFKNLGRSVFYSLAWLGLGLAADALDSSFNAPSAHALAAVVVTIVQNSILILDLKEHAEASLYSCLTVQATVLLARCSLPNSPVTLACVHIIPLSFHRITPCKLLAALNLGACLLHLSIAASFARFM